MKKIVLTLGMLTASFTHTTVNWHSTDIYQVSPIVLNENISIKGTCTLNDTVTVKALNCDVTVEVDSKSSITGQGSLVLLTKAPYNIMIKVKKNLSFYGSPNTQINPLNIILVGNGTVQWELYDGKDLYFTAHSNGSGVVVWQARHPNYSEDFNLYFAIPNQIFKFNNQDQIHFGAHSHFGYWFRGAMNNGISTSTLQLANTSSDIVFQDGCEIACRFINTL
ncbi:hypothetical protein IPH25_04165 [bacterium]|nr:MAG: hypothetical protein IPG37_01160 [bacterium]QQR61642.1 MAG: hypothetical protein IPH25_04165 [bacterium]QQR62793.1 MAG: hypothetical protein IPH67_05295 [bacterium]